MEKKKKPRIEVLQDRSNLRKRQLGQNGLWKPQMRVTGTITESSELSL